jgi:hypothetical protein
MIHIMWNRALNGSGWSLEARPREIEILRNDLLARLFRKRLPSTWDVEFRISDTQPGPDAILSIRPAEGAQITLLVEVKSVVEPRDIPRLVHQLNSYGEKAASVVVAPYLSPRTQEALATRSINFADLTGNIRFVVEDPFIYIHDRGATTDPWRENRPVHSLKGPAAGRVVRALCDFCPPYRIRELSARASIPVASVSRITQLLQREALIARGEAGEVVEVHWKDLIRRWTEDYNFATSNHVSNYFDPRGPQHCIERLLGVENSYAVTGSFAATQVAPYAPPRLAAIYAENVDALALELGLRPVSSGINVFLARPFNPVVFDRVWTVDGRAYAALSQVAADLITGPGRSPSEAEELLDWMEEHEDAWRV